MDVGELLQTSYPPKPEHRLCSSPQWWVAVLSPVVDPSTICQMAIGKTKVGQCRTT